MTELEQHIHDKAKLLATMQTLVRETKHIQLQLIDRDPGMHDKYLGAKIAFVFVIDLIEGRVTSNEVVEFFRETSLIPTLQHPEKKIRKRKEEK